MKDFVTDDALANEAVSLAAELLAASRAGEKQAERRQAAKLARMMEDPRGKAFAFALADQVFRPPTAARSAEIFRDLIADFGVPDYLPAPERVAMEAGCLVSSLAPGLVMRGVTGVMRAQSSRVILPMEDAKLGELLVRRKRAGMRMNLNHLGEAILGEGEAEKRIRTIINRLASPGDEQLSVKISAIFSQIHLVGFDESLSKIMDRLRRIYRAAMATPGKPRMVNLDMEEYRDLHLTRAAFTGVLDEPEFHHLEAGIALQAYLPDAWQVQRELNEWARGRMAKGGAGIKLRLVKGANLAMETVDAELHGWPAAPYLTKSEVDANYKRMLHEGCRPENAAAVRLGVASHNLFDIAYALLLRSREGVGERVEFEMLEGMANHQARAVHQTAGDLLLYAPVVARDQFHHAIAYLIRRLDENTSEENFLRHLFSMRHGDAAWESQKQRFLSACASKDTVSAAPRRDQDRSKEDPQPLAVDAPFRNEPDTDWSLRHNTRWIREVVRQTLARPVSPHTLAGAGEIEHALQTAVTARESWRKRGLTARSELLVRVAAEIARSRGEAIGTMVSDAAKSVVEADSEVSEAIDFANYYAAEIPADGTGFEPFGTVLITPPWNFPFAIPCGGVLAALVAGNTVILKPAPETVRTARMMVECLWHAGIPRDVLQFLPCADDETGRALVTDDRIGAVVLTGAYETARMFLDWKPLLRLFAETSGKNALVITAAADTDLAIRDLVRSAFGHSGQKCSAASLAIVEAELYDQPAFRNQLRDAVSSLPVGPASEFDSIVTPVIREPGKALKKALTRLDAGEEWLLEPRMIDGNPCLWSPGIRLGVEPGSWFHRTECFGPVLGLIRAKNLEHAIQIQNDSEFGLTGGIHSLDHREIRLWKERVEVGNAYVNRPITGAIVRRQPFGGWKRSSFGPGAKAGGPNYTAQFGVWKNTGLPSKSDPLSPAVRELLGKLVSRLPDCAEILVAAAGSDAYWNTREFGVEHDPSGLRCEFNIFRYRPFRSGLIRAGSDVELARLLLVATAIPMEVGVSIDIPRPWLDGLGYPVTVESDANLLERFDSLGNIEVIRWPLGPLEVKAAVIAAGKRWADGPALWDARHEWPAWLREQAISETLHRYGNPITGFPAEP